LIHVNSTCDLPGGTITRQLDEKAPLFVVRGAKNSSFQENTLRESAPPPNISIILTERFLLKSKLCSPRKPLQSVP
jgi:hypothetical protein